MPEHHQSKKKGEPEYGLFVQAVQGKIVRRYGTPTHIGVTDRDGEPQWDTDTIYPLTAAEMLRYGAEYTRALKEGALKEVKRDAWEAQTKTRTEERDHVAKVLRTVAGSSEDGKALAQRIERELKRPWAEIREEELVAWARADWAKNRAPAEPPQGARKEG
jgi:hypothetical protein